MKYLIFIFIPLVFHSQEVKDFEVFFQNILDNEVFINLVETNSEFKCENSLLILNKQEMNLKYQNMNLLTFNNNESCPGIIFNVTKINKRKYHILAYISSTLMTSSKTGYSKSIICRFVIKRKKNSFKLINNKRKSYIYLKEKHIYYL